MAAVHTCTLRQPRAMYSTASRHVLMPPMPDRDRFGSLRVARDLRHVQADRLDGRAGVAAVAALAVDGGLGTDVSRLTYVMEFTVLIRLTASAPPARDARAA